jgi:hypothetical protein
MSKQVGRKAHQSADSGSLLFREEAMNSLIHWFTYENILATLVTVGVALLLVCCLECSDCSGRDKDDFFHRHTI